MVKSLFYYFLRRNASRLLTFIGVLGCSGVMVAQAAFPEESDSLFISREIRPQTTALLSNVGPRLVINRGIESGRMNDTVDIHNLQQSRLLSIQQLLKGNVSGMYVQENNGEPGSIQSMIIRGLSAPIFSNKDVSGVQPAVYVNGIPLTQDHPYLYDFKQYDYNPVGAATNLLAGVDIQTIESIEIVKDPLELAKLGPLAANGAILITTKDGFYGGKNITVNTSIGMTFAPSKIKMTNGATERAFRQQVYDTYGIPASQQSYPAYLSDTREPNYFGIPDWADSYYSSSPVYNVNASIGSGNSIANYIFTLGIANDQGMAKDVGLSKYNIGFALNMTPVKGLTASTYIHANRIDRKRNKNIRDRLAEVVYQPDLSMPVAPANGMYDRLLDIDKLTKDENLVDGLNGYLSLRYLQDRFYANAGIQLDYTTNKRHVFWPSGLLEGMSYASDFSGYNRRLIGNASAGYLFDFTGGHALDVRWDGSLQSDYYHYNYARGYDGDDDTKTSVKYGIFSKMYALADRVESRLVSTSVTFDYNYKKLLYASLLFRYDGSSNIQLDNRWLFTPAFSLGWDLRKQFLETSSAVSVLKVNASWARIGRIIESDRFAVGPNYVSSEMGWSGQSMLTTSNGFATVTRPYSIGWVGYNMGWPYSDKLSVDLNAVFLNNRIHTKFSFYENRDKDMILQMPVTREYGYESKFVNGLEIANRGVELSVSAAALTSGSPDRLAWDIALNMNYNRNEVKKLPDGLHEVVVNNRKLQIGEAIDAFWLYKNKGIYTDDSQVPVKDGNVLSANGISFQAGDPVWEDVNGDYVIDDNDRVLMGNSMPKFTGGLTNYFRYKGFDLSFHLFFALGHSALNVRDQQRYDFMTGDGIPTVATVKEIFFWQEGRNQKNDYPLYNPLSKVNPYRAEQDLFLEKLSYLKLRNITIGYTLPLKKSTHQLIESLYLYITAENLFTITGFSGNDPELVGFNGYYEDYSMGIPRSALLGVRFKF